jgi:glutathione synthase/RimK-type ligase-like ATP-grasp enzyme
VIVKPFERYVGSLTEGLRVIYTNRLLDEHLARLDELATTPAIVQEYVPKDVELRVTVVGKRVFPAAIHTQESATTRDDWRRPEDDVRWETCSLPPSLEALCVTMLERLGLSYGVFDLVRRPDGGYVFLEINADGDFLEPETQLELPIAAAIVDLLCSA